MEIDLHRLIAFHAVAATGGFTRAALKLHVTQPTISVQVRKLEEQIGARLFERLPRKVVLTKAGELLFERTTRIQGVLEDIVRAFDDLSGLKKGKLSVACNQSTAMHVLPPHLAAFTARYPLVDVEIRTDSTRRIRDAVLEGAVELGMVLVPPEGQGLAWRRVTRWQMVLVCPTGHPLAEGPLRLERITEHPFISYTDGTEARALIHRPFEALDAELKVRLELGSTDLVVRYVALGHGIAIVHDIGLQKGPPEGVVLRSMSRYYPPGHVHVVWRKDRPLSAAGTAFVRMLGGEGGSDSPGSVPVKPRNEEDLT